MENINAKELGIFIRKEVKSAVVSSRVVSENFEKPHNDVLKVIRRLECSEEFIAGNFSLVEYVDAKGERRPEYLITRDGFVFLAMGFTGAKAAKWKEAYINAFNEMERKLENIALGGGNSPALDPHRPTTRQLMCEEKLEFAVRFFLEDCCETGWNKWLSRSDLYFYFTQWCRLEGIYVPSQNVVTTAMNRIARFRPQGAGWYGVAIKRPISTYSMALDVGHEDDDGMTAHF